MLWLQGFADQAVRTAETSIEEAQATGHAMSLCYTLALAGCSIALWSGNLTAAGHHTRMLLDLSKKHSLLNLVAVGSMYQRVVDLKGGDVVTHINGFPIEHPEEALEAFKSLEVSSELRVDYEREGVPRDLRYAIVDDEPALAPAAKPPVK